MKHLFMGAAAIALLGACGGSDSDESTVVSTPEVKINAKHSELASLTDFDVKAGDPSKVADVLAMLKLDSSGSGLATFGSSDIDGDGATFTDLVVGPDGADDAVKIGKVELDGLNMTDAGAVFSKLVVNDVEAGDGDEAVSLDEFAIVNPSPELAAFLSKAFSGEDPGDFPPIEQISFDAVSFGDFSFSGGDDEDGGVVKVANIALQGMGDGELEAAVLSGLTFNAEEDGEPLIGGIGKMAFYGASYAFIEEIQALGDDPDEEAVMAVVMSSMSDATNPPYDGIVMEDMKFEGSGINFDLPLMDMIVQRDDQDRMTATVLKPMTMTLSADAEGGEGGAELAEGLSMLGYKDITLKAEGITTYDPDADIVSYKEGSNYIELVDGARIAYGGKLEGFSAYSKAAAAMNTQYGPDPSAMQDAFSKLTVHNFSLTIDDDSLVDRLFTLAASQSGEDPQQLRNQAVMMMGMAPMMAAQSGVDSELLTEAVGAATEFIKEPGTLTISLNPGTPLNIGELIEAGDPSALTKDALGFSATHK